MAWLAYRLFCALIVSFKIHGWDNKTSMPTISDSNTSSPFTLLLQLYQPVVLEIFMRLKVMPLRLLLYYCFSLLVCSSILRQLKKSRVSWPLMSSHPVIMQIIWLKSLRISLSRLVGSSHLIDKSQGKPSLTGRGTPLDTFNIVQTHSWPKMSSIICYHQTWK